LHGEREQIFNQQHELEGKLADINRELSAIDAYEAAKSGKAVRQPRARGPQRARRGSKRKQVLELIKQHPGDLARKDSLERLGLKGDKAGAMSVSNALNGMTKAIQVTRRDGRYIVA
jgi:hypothetical protein